MARVLPILRGIRRESSIALSIDTSKAEVARAALAEGADIVNDVWGLKRDPGISQIVAESGAGLVVMHNRGTEAPAPDAAPPAPAAGRPADILGAVVASLRESLDLAAAAGVPDDAVAVDPGIGFGVPAEDSLRMIDGIPAVRALGRPVLIGPSRKSFIGKVLDLPVERRLLGTAAAVAYGIARGADFVRVHDVAEMREIVRMADAIRASGLRDGGVR
jgi:dihydropteroate synthase